MPMCSKGGDSKNMFPASDWDFNKVSNKCFEQFKVRPNKQMATTVYGGNHLEYVLIESLSPQSFNLCQNIYVTDTRRISSSAMVCWTRGVAAEFCAAKPIKSQSSLYRMQHIIWTCAQHIRTTPARCDKHETWNDKRSEDGCLRAISTDPLICIERHCIHDLSHQTIIGTMLGNNLSTHSQML